MLVLAQSRMPSLSTAFQPAASSSSPSAMVTGTSAAAFCSLRTVNTTRGPMVRAPNTANTTRLMPKSGVNTKNTMIKAGKFIVAEPCTMAIAPASPALL